MINDILPPYHYFGSQNSQDIDVVFFVSKMPKSINDCAVLVKELCEILAKKKKHSKKVNGNLAILENGTLIEVFKGTVDELNNALFYTYNFHKQDYSLKIITLIERDINLKFLRCARMILSFFTKSKYRYEIKKALNGDIDLKFEILKNRNLFELIEQNDVDLKKILAFQIGQAMALDNGIELYSKDEIGNHYITLKPYLNRELRTSMEDLNIHLSMFLDKLIVKKASMDIKIEYKFQKLSSNI